VESSAASPTIINVNASNLIKGTENATDTSAITDSKETHAKSQGTRSFVFCDDELSSNLTSY
jgi:hypothetical protein